MRRYFVSCEFAVSFNKIRVSSSISDRNVRSHCSRWPAWHSCHACLFTGRSAYLLQGAGSQKQALSRAVKTGRMMYLMKNAIPHNKQKLGKGMTKVTAPGMQSHSPQIVNAPTRNLPQRGDHRLLAGQRQAATTAICKVANNCSFGVSRFPDHPDAHARYP